jgi:hypothetical protein
MMFTSRKSLKTLGRWLAGFMAGAWLMAAAAPCVMAGNDCGLAHGSKQCALPDMVAQCGSAALDCELPSPNPLTTASLDLPTPLAVAIATLPALPAPIIVPERRWQQARWQIPFTPLNLQHARLLI